MFKPMVVITGLSLFLVACEERNLIYQEEERPLYEVEEIIESNLEIENPTVDLDVSITEDTD